MTITRAIERIGRIDLHIAVLNAVDRTINQYEDLQRDQLSKGITRDGANIEPAPYSTKYAKQRRKEGLQTAFIDLKRTGEYYGKMTATVDGTVLRLSSDVDYEQFISKRYNGPLELYGLTEDNMQKYKAIVIPLIVEGVKAQYNG